MLTLNIKFKYFLVIFLLILPFGNANSKEKSNLVVHGSYTFETYEGQKNIAVYMSFFNNSDKNIEIDSFYSNLSPRIEMHDIKIQGDVVKMVMIENIVVKKKSELFLQPGGKHLMFFEITRKLIDGDSFDVKIILKNGNQFNTKVMVLNKKLKSNFLK